MKNIPARRPLKSRQTLWASKLAKSLADSGISPNMISFMSIVFAALSMLSAFKGLWYFTILAALFIQLRLICNLMDGMVAVEFGKKSKTGDLWNDVPDRFADFLIILGAGLLARAQPYAMDLAYINGGLAILTAYLRVLGASVGSPQYFSGPMAKPQRMALLTLAFLLESYFANGIYAYMALILMLVGQALTCYRRLSLIAFDLEKK